MQTVFTQSNVADAINDVIREDSFGLLRFLRYGANRRSCQAVTWESLYVVKGSQYGEAIHIAFLVLSMLQKYTDELVCQKHCRKASVSCQPAHVILVPNSPRQARYERIQHPHGH